MFVILTRGGTMILCTQDHGTSRTVSEAGGGTQQHDASCTASEAGGGSPTLGRRQRRGLLPVQTVEGRRPWHENTLSDLHDQ